MSSSPPSITGTADSSSMAETVKLHDWSRSPLGSRDGWPQSLRTTVDLMLASGHAMCLLWGPGLTLIYNDGYADFLGARHPGALGQSFQEVWAEIWDDIGPLVERTYAGETTTVTDMPLVMTRKGFAEETWWTFSYSPVFDDDGAVAGLLDVASDSSARVLAERERDEAEAKLRDSEAFMRNVLAASTDCIKVVELDGSLSFMSEGGMKAMEISDFNDVNGCIWADMLKDGGTELALGALEAARQGRSTHFESPADTYLGTPKHWSVSVSPIFSEAGTVERILSVSRDHTALEQSRAQQRLLNQELNHRLKNILAMVQSIVSQTFRDAKSLDEAAPALASRLVSLGHAADLLTSSSWHGADLRTVVNAGLAGIDGHRDRIFVSGPPLHLNAQAALAMTLALHELATNAIKYGALSNDAGTVLLEWRITGPQDARRFCLRWEERDGPEVATPTSRGFGSRLIERSLRSYFRGEANLGFPPAGVVFTIDAPLPDNVEGTK